MNSLTQLTPLPLPATVNFIPCALPDLDDDQWARCPRCLQVQPDAPRAKRRVGGLAPWQINRVTAYVDAHLAERMPLAIIAAQVRLGVSHFSRSFSKSVGLPFLQFLAQRRVAHAAELMATTDQRLCEIALTCGFADQSHFSRTFSRLAGETPAQWRRRSSRVPIAYAGRAMASIRPFQDAQSAA